jgi:ribosomal protein L37AE/L43A
VSEVATLLQCPACGGPLYQTPAGFWTCWHSGHMGLRPNWQVREAIQRDLSCTEEDVNKLIAKHRKTVQG